MGLLASQKYDIGPVQVWYLIPKNPQNKFRVAKDLSNQVVLVMSSSFTSSLIQELPGLLAEALRSAPL